MELWYIGFSQSALRPNILLSFGYQIAYFEPGGQNGVTRLLAQNATYRVPLKTPFRRLGHAGTCSQIRLQYHIHD